MEIDERVSKDLRVRITHRMLIDAFLQLRAEKPLRKIPVRELCERAGVGRGTFYAHFLDVYDLNEKLETYLLQEENGNLFMNTGFRIDVSYNEATDVLTFSPNGDYVRVKPQPGHPTEE